jgi:hypothetical protein
MKLKERLKMTRGLAPSQCGKYKTLKRRIDFADGTFVDAGKKVKILSVGMFGTRVQIPSLKFITASVAHNAIKWK